ncbi:STAS domain-containing protein [Streptomyces griseus]|uniref:STAS domain-containing protein n=1 Tax=Streptomyces griseus TaxID=1911 RepID=UPI00056A8810|nr:STAS domain-containing protein [Streptomyces griseus]
MAETQEPAVPQRLSIAHSVVDGIDVVTPHGEIDHTTRVSFHQALLPPEGAGTARLVVDLSGVTFMDSTGVNTLIAAHQAAQAAEGWLRLAGPRNPVLRILQLVGVDAVIPCYPDLQQALKN